MVRDAASVARIRRLLLFVAASLVTHGLMLVAPPLSDEPPHLIGSWTLLRGGDLYVDFVDNKPPLIYAYYALTQWLFGIGFGAIRATTLFVVLPVTAYGASAFFRHERAGLAAGLLFLVSGATFGAEDALAVNTEILMLLPAVWAFVAMRDETGAAWRAALAGALVGLSTLVKLTALPWLLAIPVAMRLAGRPLPAALKSFGAATLGCAIPILAAVAWLGPQSESAAWERVMLHNVGYVSASIDLRDAIIRAARGAGTWAVVTGPAWWAAWRGRDDPGARLAWALVLIALPAVCLGFRFFGHYYLQALLPLCIAAGPAAARLSIPPLSRAAHIAGAAVLGLFVIATVGNAWLFTRRDVLEGARPVFTNVAARLRHDPCVRGATLFVWGYAPMFYVATRMPQASRFVVPQETISGYVPGRTGDTPFPERTGQAAVDWELLFEDLERSRATYFLDTAPSGLHFWRPYPLTRFPDLSSYVRDHYTQLDVVNRVVIYRRRQCEVDR